MRNKIRYIRLIGLIFVLIVGSSLTFAQNKSKRKSAKKPLVEVISIVTDEKGSPLKNVSIICGEGAVVLYTDAKGRFQTKVENDATVMVEALGYEDKVYKLTGSNIVPEKIVLNLKSATKLFSVLLASKRPLITELADKLRLKYPLLPTISPCPTMRLEAIRSIIPISCRRYPKSV